MNISFRNRRELEAKITRFKLLGAEKLRILSDWDATITKGVVDGRPYGSYTLTEESGIMPDEYRDRCREVNAHYVPIELDDSLSDADKLPHMEEWWTKAFGAMVEYGLTKDMISEMVKHPMMQVRPGALDLLGLSSAKNIPIHILSAGVGDIIQGYLLRAQAKYYNVKITANYFKFNGSGQATGIANKTGVIHCMNKEESFADFMSDRPNVILLGDIVEDAFMTKNTDNDTIKICYTNPSRNNTDALLLVYDVVVHDDAGMDYVLNLVKDIAGSSVE